MRPRRPQHGLSGAVGDRGLQAAAPVPERGALQAHLRHIHRVQEHRIQDRQRPQALKKKEDCRIRKIALKGPLEGGIVVAHHPAKGVCTCCRV